MMTPVRLRLSRARGSNLQAHSRAVNGLAAVNVARPTKWGNPFKIGPNMKAEDAVREFRALLAPHPPNIVPLYMGADDIARELRGKNLACWCAIGSPCHADVLLEIANRPTCEAIDG